MAVALICQIILDPSSKTDPAGAVLVRSFFRFWKNQKVRKHLVQFSGSKVLTETALHSSNSIEARIKCNTVNSSSGNQLSKELVEVYDFQSKKCTKEHMVKFCILHIII